MTAGISCLHCDTFPVEKKPSCYPDKCIVCWSDATIEWCKSRWGDKQVTAWLENDLRNNINFPTGR